MYIKDIKERKVPKIQKFKIYSNANPVVACIIRFLHENNMNKNKMKNEGEHHETIF